MTIVLEPNLGDDSDYEPNVGSCPVSKRSSLGRLSRIEGIIPHREGRDSERYSASSLDDQGSVSRSRATTLQCS